MACRARGGAACSPCRLVLAGDPDPVPHAMDDLDCPVTLQSVEEVLAPRAALVAHDRCELGAAGSTSGESDVRADRFESPALRFAERFRLRSLCFERVVAVHRHLLDPLLTRHEAWRAVGGSWKSTDSSPSRWWCSEHLGIRPGGAGHPAIVGAQGRPATASGGRATLATVRQGLATPHPVFRIWAECPTCACACVRRAA